MTREEEQQRLNVGTILRRSFTPPPEPDREANEEARMLAEMEKRK